MKSKKLLALFLSMVMMFVMAIPAFAADDPAALGDDNEDNEADGTEQSMLLTGIMKDITLNVTLSDAGSVILNPYKQTVYYTATGDEFTTEDVTSTTTGAKTGSDQIIAPLVYMYSQTTVPIEVSASVQGEVSDGITLATSSIAAMKTQPTDKQIFAYVGFATVAEAGATASSTGANATYTFTAPTTAPSIPDYNAKGTDTILVTADAVSKNVATIPAAASLVKPSALAFQVKGDMTTTPDEQWIEDDSFAVNVVLTLTATAVSS